MFGYLLLHRGILKDLLRSFWLLLWYSKYTRRNRGHKSKVLLITFDRWEIKLYKWKVTYTWRCRMSMAVSQGWDANLLSHSLEFNHKAIFSLAFVFNLHKFKCLDVYPKPIRSVLPPQTKSLCTTGLGPPPEGRPSKLCLLSHIHHVIFNS